MYDSVTPRFITTPILSIPEELLLPILRKVDVKSLCRLRIASKIIHNYVESNSNRISCRSSKAPIVLIVTVTNSVKPRLEFRVSFKKFPKKYGFLDGCVSRLRYEKLAYLTNPNSQLSGCYIYSIYVRSPISTIFLTWKQICDLWGDDIAKQHSVWKHHALPILKAASLSCRWLCVERFPQWMLGELTSYVRFERFFAKNYVDYLPYEEILQTNVNQLQECHLKMITENDRSLALHQPDLRDLWNKHGRSALSQFLQIIRVNKEARGKLRRVTLYKHKDNEKSLDGIEGLRRIWSGRINRFGEHSLPVRYTSKNMDLYQMPIAGGIAVLANFATPETDEMVEILFIPDGNREILLEFLFPRIFEWAPFDLSGTYEKFLQKGNEEAAFNALCGDYYADNYTLIEI